MQVPAGPQDRGVVGLRQDPGVGAGLTVATLPDRVQPLARLNPVTPTTAALRGLAGGGAVPQPALQALAWIVATLCCGAVAIRRYRRLA